jgi:hypothetical protein
MGIIEKDNSYTDHLSIRYLLYSLLSCYFLSMRA